MNFFFGFKNTLFNSELVVPRFQNCGKTRDYYSLFSAEIDDGKWLIKNISENHDKDFFYINYDQPDAELKNHAAKHPNCRRSFLATPLMIINFGNRFSL